MLHELINEQYDKVLIEKFLEEMELYQSNHYGGYNRERLERAYKSLPDFFKQMILPKRVSHLHRGADGVGGDYGAISFTDKVKNAFFYGHYAIPFHELQSYDGLIDTHKVVQFTTRYRIQSDVGDDENEVIVINPVWKNGLEDRIENYSENSLLKEDDINEVADMESIYSKYFPHINKIDFIKLVAADPTSVVVGNGYDVKKVGRYVKWLAKIYENDPEFKMEDLYKAKQYLQVFDKYKQKMNVKDIFRFSSIQDLYAEVEPTLKALLSNKSVTNAEKEREIKSTGSKKIFEDATWLVVHPLTKDAACYYGKNTQWCTAADDDGDNAFDEYNKEGDLIIFINKTTNKKFQVHFQSGQLMNENDRPIDYLAFFNDNPQLKKAVGMENYVTGLISQGQNVFNTAIEKEPEILKYITQDFLVHQLKNQKRANIKVWLAYYFESLPLEIEKMVLKDSSDNLIFLKNPSEQAKEFAVEKSAESIRLVKDPSEELQLKAISQNPSVLNYLHNPTLRVISKAIFHDGTLIRYVEKKGWKVPESVYFNAVDNNNLNPLAYIQKPSEELQLHAVNHFKPVWEDGKLKTRLPLGSIKGKITNEKAQWELIKKLKGYALIYIENPSRKMLVTAITAQPDILSKTNGAINHVHIDDELQLLAVKVASQLNDDQWTIRNLWNYVDEPAKQAIHKIIGYDPRDREDYYPN